MILPDPWCHEHRYFTKYIRFCFALLNVEKLVRGVRREEEEYSNIEWHNDIWEVSSEESEEEEEEKEEEEEEKEEKVETETEIDEWENINEENDEDVGTLQDN